MRRGRGNLHPGSQFVQYLELELTWEHMSQKLNSSTLLQSPIASSRVDPTSTLLNLKFTIKSELAKLTNCCAQSLQRDSVFIYLLLLFFPKRARHNF